MTIRLETARVTFMLSMYLINHVLTRNNEQKIVVIFYSNFRQSLSNKLRLHTKLNKLANRLTAAYCCMLETSTL